MCRSLCLVGPHRPLHENEDGLWERIAVDLEVTSVLGEEAAFRTANDGWDASGN
jgi:hypothetical protein